jgi:hypothetical protein
MDLSGNIILQCSRRKRASREVRCVKYRLRGAKRVIILNLHSFASNTCSDCTAVLVRECLTRPDLL